jgi:hypothetical protein
LRIFLTNNELKVDNDANDDASDYVSASNDIGDYVVTNNDVGDYVGASNDVGDYVGASDDASDDVSNYVVVSNDATANGVHNITSLSSDEFHKERPWICLNITCENPSFFP